MSMYGGLKLWISLVLLFGKCVYNEGAMYIVREVRRGRGVTVLSRDKPEVLSAGGRRW